MAKFEILILFYLASKQWAAPKVSGESPAARYFHSACLFKNFMLVFGGCTSSGYKDSRNDLYVLNLETLEWKKPRLSGNVPSPRHGHSLTAIDDNRVALFGGAIEDSGMNGKPVVTRYNDLYTLDMRTFEWSLENASGSAPNPRVFHSAALIEKRLWIFGGECDMNQTDLTVLEIGNLPYFSILS